MKVIVEFDTEQDAIQALRAANWHNAMWWIDKELRGIVKHGYIGCREATDCEIEVFSKCREMLREAMNDNNLTFDI